MSAPARRRAAADTDTVRLHAGTDSGESTKVAMTATRARRQREHKGGDAGTDCDESTEAANVSALTRHPFAAESDTICHHAGTDKGESMEVATSALMATRAQRLRTWPSLFARASANIVEKADRPSALDFASLKPATPALRLDLP